jgi:membrane protein DedA with SNARE-associated domain
VAVHEEEAHPPDRPAVRSGSKMGLVGGAFVLMMAGRFAGAAISPVLLAHAPLALLVLSPVIAHLVIVAALSDAVSYYSVALPVAIGQCSLGFFLGRLQGPLVVEFLVRKGFAAEDKVQRLLTLLRVSAPLLVFVIPGPIVCTLAGASGVPRRTFLPALVASQVLWVALCRLFGQALLGSIAAMREGIARHVIPLTVVTVLIVLIVRFRRVKRQP